MTTATARGDRSCGRGPRAPRAGARRRAGALAARPARTPLAGLVLLAALAAGPAGTTAQPAGECRVVDDFAEGRVGEFPPDWRPRKDAGRAVYSVQQEGPLRFLHAAAHGLGIQAARAHAWDLGTYPVLAWAWRVLQFPSGADEREPRTNDSALAVYLLVPYSRVTGPKAVKYVWSERVPPGSRLGSNGGLTQVRVLRSGRALAGQWVEERVNVRDDFLAYFGETAVPRPAGIAVLTDADDTRSSARGDYAAFRVCRE